jgi:soluble lytic murein transglycosylase-like protein
MKIRVQARLRRRSAPAALPPPPKPVPAVIHQQLQTDSPENWYKRVGGPALEKMYKLPKGILKHLIEKESKGDPKAKSQRGAMGLFQIMPAAQSGFSGNPYNPVEAAKYVAETLAKNIRHFGDNELALAAYNWGRGNVIRKGLENAPEETRQFLDFFRNRGILT